MASTTLYDPERDLQISEHDMPVLNATNGYTYEDCTVTLHVGRKTIKTYKVGRSRLTQRSPVFRDMFGLPQPPASLPLPPSPPSAFALISSPPAPSAAEPVGPADWAWDDPSPDVGGVLLYDEGPLHYAPVEPSYAFPVLYDSERPSIVPNNASPPAASFLPSPEATPEPGVMGVSSPEMSPAEILDRPQLPSLDSLSDVAEPVSALPPPDVVRLYDEPEEFEHYLWAIHADVLDLLAFLKEPASARKCTRLLCIARIAHKYESTRMANRMLGDALDMLEANTTIHISEDLAALVLHVPRLWVDKDITARGRKILVEAMRNSTINTFSVIFMAEPLEDRELLGWGYYYLLKDPEQRWRNDARVRDIDRRRLYAGAYALSVKWHQCCQACNFTQGMNSMVPSWVIFDKLPMLPRSYNRPSNRDVMTAEIVGRLYEYFNPDA